MKIAEIQNIIKFIKSEKISHCIDKKNITFNLYKIIKMQIKIQNSIINLNATRIFYSTFALGCDSIPSQAKRHQDKLAWTENPFRTY